MKEIAKLIDHTNLNVLAQEKDINKLCNEAIKYNFKSVCISPNHVSYAKRILQGKIKICTVIGFPLGYANSTVKVFETNEAIKNGADEIDMVINIQRLKECDYEYIIQEINDIRAITKDIVLKVIIETCFLSNDEIKKMCEICINTKVDFIKTSTGFGTRGVSYEDIELINLHKGNLKVKASGGIRTNEKLLKLVELGVDRLGMSAMVDIIEGDSLDDSNSKY